VPQPGNRSLSGCRHRTAFWWMHRSDRASAALGACLLVLIVAVALDRRPYRPGKPNYIPIMIVALAASLVRSESPKFDGLQLVMCFTL
jgi:hypothetical protein